MRVVIDIYWGYMDSRLDFNINEYDKPGYVFIAGCPKSATHYIAEVFQRVDQDVRHEAFGERGIAAFHIIPHLSQRQHGLILHQVRDPLKTISSMQTIENSWTYITYYTGITREGGLLHANMRLWHRLNSEIEKHDHKRYRIEDIDLEWPKICDMCKISVIPIPDVPRNLYSKLGKFRNLSWHELEFRDAELTKYIKDMAVRYGYEVE